MRNRHEILVAFSCKVHGLCPAISFVIRRQRVEPAVWLRRRLEQAAVAHRGGMSW